MCLSVLCLPLFLLKGWATNRENWPYSKLSLLWPYTAHAMVFIASQKYFLVAFAKSHKDPKVAFILRMFSYSYHFQFLVSAFHSHYRYLKRKRFSENISYISHTGLHRTTKYSPQLFHSSWIRLISTTWNFQTKTLWRYFWYSALSDVYSRVEAFIWLFCSLLCGFERIHSKIVCSPRQPRLFLIAL